jgi:hypothetical protein
VKSDNKQKDHYVLELHIQTTEQQKVNGDSRPTKQKEQENHRRMPSIYNKLGEAQHLRRVVSWYTN